MNIHTPTSSTDLIVMRPLTAAMVFVPGGVDSILEKIRAEVMSFKPDISTPSGRAAIASIAYKVARSKTALDEMGKDLVAEWKSKASAVDAERRVVRERLDALKDEVRKPLTDWENADKLRIEAHEKAILDIAALLDFGGMEPTAAQLKERIEILAARPARKWEEFVDRASDAVMVAGKRLEDLHAAAVTRESERAELERLRAEQMARAQKEREDRIAAEAAERARREAEEKAAAAAAAAAEVARKERESLEAERHAARLEAVRAESERREAQLRADAAEAARIEQAARAEEEKKLAAAAAERNRLAAIEAERKRAADAKAAEDAAAAKREADKKHRAKINGEARDAFAAAGMTIEQATAAVTAIAKGAVPHVKISY